jgi:DNA polymerase-3 subunit epsilon
MKPIIFLDLETTGVSVKEDRIVEISIVKREVDGTIDKRTRRFNPTIPIPPAVSEVIGITDDDVKDLPPFEKFAPSILRFMEGTDIVGFNSNRFDLPLLNNEFIRAGLVWDYRSHHLIDAGNIYKLMNPRTLASAYLLYKGIELVDAHSAEADALATMEVFDQVLINHPELAEMDREQLAIFSNFDKKVLDLSGMFTYNGEGEIVYAFGKYRGEKASKYPDFLDWMTNRDFPPDTMAICYELLGRAAPTKGDGPF